MSFEDLFDEDLTAALPVELSPGSITSSPIEFSGVLGAAAPADIASPSTSAPTCRNLTCTECKKVLKTKSGFTRHLALHKLNHFNSRKPLEEDLCRSTQDLFQKVCLQILHEPSISVMGLQKRQLVDALHCKRSEDVLLLLEAISKPVIDIVLVRTKVMPSAQYEDALKSLNLLLSDESFCGDVKRKLLPCVPEELRSVPDRVLQRLVWQMTSIYFFEIQELVLKKMKERNATAYEKYTMGDQEKETFKDHIANIVRAVYKFGLKTGNAVWNLRCKSLKEKFVDTSEAITEEQFLNIQLWESKFITLSEAAFNIFWGIEQIIQNLQDCDTAFTADIIFENLTNAENLLLFNYMRDLTRGILSEDLAIDFLRDLVSSLTALSGKLEAKRKLGKIAKKQKTSSVSLRTNLKRNPVATPATQAEAEAEDDPAPLLTVQTSTRKDPERYQDKASTSTQVAAQPKSKRGRPRNAPVSEVSRRKESVPEQNVATSSSSAADAGTSKCSQVSTRTSSKKDTLSEGNPTRRSSRLRTLSSLK